MKIYKKGPTIFGLISLFFITALVIMFILPKRELNNVVENEIDYHTKAINTTVDELTILIKDYYYNNNLIEEDNLIYWTINKITYLGYNKNNDSYFYKVEGDYKCKENNSCVYLEQELTTYPNFIIYLEISIDNNEYKIKTISSSLSSELIEKETSLSEDETITHKMSQEIKNYFSEKTFIETNNLEYWNITNVEYSKKVNDTYTYYVESNYRCKDYEDTCIYNEQSGEAKEDKSYDFNFYIDTLQNDKIKTIYNVLSSSTSSLTKEKVIELTKNYFINNNLAFEKEILKWNINKVTYAGYYPSKSDEKIINVSGEYQCTDNSSECIYLEQISKPVNNIYEFNIYIVLKDNEIINIYTTLVGEITSINETIE